MMFAAIFFGIDSAPVIRSAAMSDARTVEREPQVRMEDVVEVGSRVSWGAILAGAVMAMAVGFILSLLGAAIWAVVTTVVALFIGGWITSQCVVGETKTESVVHGIIMWGVVLAMLLWLTAAGIGAGFSSMLQVANVGANASQNATQQDWQMLARAAGVSQADIDRWRESAQATADDPEAQRQMQEEVHETATYATWWTFAGAIVSMAAAVCGAMVGAGPTFRLLPLHVTHRHYEASTRAMPG
jgi:hypothetical protein